MLNKPKFMSPSINMYGNSVIDLNSTDNLPFSCIVDGNEAVTDFRIVISRLKDNVVVFDTGMKKLDKPFFPINNRNQNVVFKINLKDYFLQISSGEKYVDKPIILNTDSEYNENKTYYKHDTATNMYTIYEYDKSKWVDDYPNLYTEEFINSADAYYWAITFKNENSGTETYSTAEVFYANSVPSTEISYSYKDDFSDSSQDFQGLQKRKVYFKSTYSQAEGVSLKRYGWRLTDTTNNYVIMDTISKNQIYGVADDISCICNGLTNETDYQLELFIETQNGYFDVLSEIKFDVNYSVTNLKADFEVVALNNTSGIMLNWGNLRTTEGVVVGDAVSYTEDFPVQSSTSIEIPDNTSVVFAGTSNSKELEIDEGSYVALSFQIEKGKNMTLFEMSGQDELSNVVMRKLESVVNEDTTVLQYTARKGDIIASTNKPLSKAAGELSWNVVVLEPLINDKVEFKHVESTAKNGLFPTGSLYPSKSTYPKFGEWNKIRS